MIEETTDHFQKEIAMEQVQITKIPGSASVLDKVSAEFDTQTFLTLHEEMSFSDYLEQAYADPKLIRTAYQRIYDMIMSAGTKEFKKYRKTWTDYNFFHDSEIPIFGLHRTTNDLVKFIRGAAGGYGTERRILLLHGPVGSAKSTICRLLKKGLERYSRTNEGRWYTYKWKNLPTGEDGIYTNSEDECPMLEDPIKLIPPNIRENILKDLNEIWREQHKEEDRSTLYSLKCNGDLNPRCKKFMEILLLRNKGDWKKVVESHIVVVRKVYSEADRCGIATFQPKDEKNQDATELTGDINFAKIAQFGSDSDPRAFNFDGEFCKGNRGVVEFIEMLKLAKEFLYDLLGASQEQNIKPKKFPQIAIDLVLVGHSVHGDTPIPHEYNGVLDVLPISALKNLSTSKLKVFSMNMDSHQVELTDVSSVFSHDFKGEWVKNIQDGDSLTTTPNHSVYNTDYNTFYPGEDTTSDMLRAEIPVNLVDGKDTTSRWDEFFQN